MSIPYVVRKKADLSSGERKESWYGVPKSYIRRMGNRELARYMEKYSGFHRGQIEGMLTEMVDAIYEQLSMGRAVTIEGLGTFHTALKSEGCKRPELVTPGKVKVSRAYFVACPDFSRRMRELKTTRVPFHTYMPETALTPAMRMADQRQSRQEVAKTEAEAAEE